jgi:hypothetical protein
MNLCVMLAELSFRVLWLQLQIYWDTYSHSGSEQIPHLTCSQKVHYCVHQELATVSCSEPDESSPLLSYCFLWTHCSVIPCQSLFLPTVPFKCYEQNFVFMFYLRTLPFISSLILLS